MTFSHYGCMHLECMWVCCCWWVVGMGWCWTSPVAQTVLNHSPQFVITRSSQSKAVPACTWSAPWLRSPVRCTPPVLPGRSPFPPASYLLGPWCAWAGVQHEQPSESAADPNHAWRGHLMWKARVNKIPAGRKMHNHCLGTGPPHHEACLTS